jgi:hypothetical protein
MARVFLSHASADAAVAEEVYQWLDAEGHEVFLDQHPRDGIPIGEEWQRQLHQHLQWSNAMVCLLTSAYLASTWCTAELGIAQSRGNRILPVLVEPGVEHPLLDAVQHLDMIHDPVAARTRLATELHRMDSANRADGGYPFLGLDPLRSETLRVRPRHPGTRGLAGSVSADRQRFPPSRSTGAGRDPPSRPTGPPSCSASGRRAPNQSRRARTVDCARPAAPRSSFITPIRGLQLARQHLHLGESGLPRRDRRTQLRRVESLSIRSSTWARS